MMQQLVEERMHQDNFAILDIEYIRISKTHCCVRKLYMLAKNGYDELEMEFYPCVRFEDLKKQYQRSFRFCRNYIHKLEYYPEPYVPECSTAKNKINTFIIDNGINLILYKGGKIERDFCEGELFIPSYNIECFPELEKVQSHDPRIEVNCYYKQLVELGYF